MVVLLMQSYAKVTEKSARTVTSEKLNGRTAGEIPSRNHLLDGFVSHQLKEKYL